MRFIFQRVKPPDSARRKSDWIRSTRGSKSKAQFNVRELRKLAALAQIDGRHQMSKLELAEALDQHYAANRILIAWRARKRRARQRGTSAAHAVAPHLEILNNRDEETGLYIDPITLDVVEQPSFTFKISEDKHVHYSLKSLLEYLLKGKVFKDPVTGVAYTDAHLREIDTLAHQHNLRVPSVLLLSRSTFPALQREHQNLVAGLERIAGAYIERFRQIIQLEHPFVNSNQAARYFNERLHYEFLDSYNQLYQIDSEAASIAMSQWIQFLRGPPQHPTPDPAKFLDGIVTWMNNNRMPR